MKLSPCRIQSIDLQTESINWFLHDDLHTCIFFLKTTLEKLTLVRTHTVIGYLRSYSFLFESIFQIFFKSANCLKFSLPVWCQRFPRRQKTYVRSYVRSIYVLCLRGFIFSSKMNWRGLWIFLPLRSLFNQILDQSYSAKICV